MKKIIFIIIFILFVSGCSVEYNLEIDDQLNFTENSLVKISKDQSDYIVFVEEDLIKYGVSYSRVESEDYINFNIENNYTNLSEVQNNELIKEFYSVDYSEKNDIIDISLISTERLESLIIEDEYYGRILDDLKINLTIPFEVLNHNATSVDGNIYTWVINEDNYESGIKISFKSDGVVDEKSNIIESNDESEVLNDFNSTMFIIVGILVVIGAIAIFVFIKYRKNNKI